MNHKRKVILFLNDAAFLNSLDVLIYAIILKPQTKQQIVLVSSVDMLCWP